jgi:hypothetical protein
MSIQFGVGVMCEQSGRCDVCVSRCALRGVVRLAGVGGLRKKKADCEGRACRTCRAFSAFALWWVRGGFSGLYVRAMPLFKVYVLWVATGEKG